MDSNKEYKKPTLARKLLLYAINSFFLLILIAFATLYNINTVVLFSFITIVLYFVLLSIGVISIPNSDQNRNSILNTVGSLFFSLSVFTVLLWLFFNRYDPRTGTHYKVDDTNKNKNQISDVMRHIAMNTNVNSKLRVFFGVESNYTIDNLPSATVSSEDWDFDLMFEKEGKNYTHQMYEPTLHYLKSLKKSGKDNIYSRPLFDNENPMITINDILKVLDLPAANTVGVREMDAQYFVKDYQGQGSITIELIPLIPNSNKYIVRKVHVITVNSNPEE